MKALRMCGLLTLLGLYHDFHFSRPRPPVPTNGLVHEIIIQAVHDDDPVSQPTPSSTLPDTSAASGSSSAVSSQKATHTRQRTISRDLKSDIQSLEHEDWSPTSGMRANKPSILPRISTGPSGGSSYAYAYEALNGGSGNPVQNGWRTLWAWRRFALGGFLLLTLAWLGFGSWMASPMDNGDSLSTENGFNIPKPVDDTHPQPHPHTPARPPALDKPRPVLTFEKDPNPASTEQCSTPYVSPDGTKKPLVQWALMIDAGSTGSRIHVYKFNNCYASPTFEYEVFMQTRPGLSSYASDATRAAKSLDPLMKKAEAVVPKSLWKCTPVAVKATAGLRLLGTTESNAILHAVKHHLSTAYSFPVVSKDGVVIMDGKDEGVYAWITANYLLGTLPSAQASSSNARTTPYAVLDLGGASTQIVFKPFFDRDGDGIDDEKGLEDGEHKYDLHFGGATHVLYQHSYLGYGLMRARAGVHRVVEFMSSYATASSRQKPPSLGGGPDDDEDGFDAGVDVVANPCIARTMKRRVEVDIGRDGAAILKNVTMTGGDIGGWAACNRVLELVLAKDAVCHLKPCSFNGVYQPSLLDSFSDGPVLLLSYFYDRIAPLLAPPSSTSSVDLTEDVVFPISVIKNLARAVCEGPSTWTQHAFPHQSHEPGAPKRWGESEAVMAELADRPEYCLDLSFMYALLRLGYEFGEERGVRIGKQVKGTELGWCLGATLGLLGSADFECRA